MPFFSRQHYQVDIFEFTFEYIWLKFVQFVMLGNGAGNTSQDSKTSMKVIKQKKEDQFQKLRQELHTDRFTAQKQATNAVEDLEKVKRAMEEERQKRKAEREEVCLLILFSFFYCWPLLNVVRQK